LAVINKNTNMAKQNQEKTIKETQKLMCGIVMPISEIDGCNESHWKEVYSIISQSIDKAGFDSNLVSNSDEVGVIQKRIIQNLYDNPIVVVDVSGKNPNVMLELGMRLAFDKPTIIIKDDKTDYSFDTSPIEHLEYPRDLRFSKIVEFKDRLANKIEQTHKKASTDKNYSTFLKHFGSFKVAQIETEVVSKEDYILEEIKTLREVVVRNNRNSNKREFLNSRERSLFDDIDSTEITMCFGDTNPKELETLLTDIIEVGGVESAEIEKLHDEHCHIEVKLNGNRPKRHVIRSLNKIAGENTRYIK
jgi:hypothetical protein